jgi:acetyl esterase/lipase
MRKFIIGVVMGVFLGTPALAAPPPLEVYGNLPTLSDVVISPDGNRLAYVQQVGTDRVLEVTDLSGKSATVGISLGDKKLRGIKWAGDTHLLIYTSTASHILGGFGSLGEWFQVQSLDVTTGKQLDLLTRQSTMIVNVAYGAPIVRKVDGETRVFITSGYMLSGGSELALFSLKLDGSEAQVVESKSEYSEGWILDDAGNPVAEIDYDDQTEHWALRIRVDGFWKEVLGRQAPIDQPNVWGLTPDGTAIVYQDIDDEAYQTILLKDGSAGPPFKTAEIGALLSDPATDRIIGAAKLTTTPELEFFDPAADQAWKSVAASFPNCTDTPTSWTPDWKKVVIHVECPAYGNMYVLVDLATNKAHLVGPEYQGVSKSDYLPVSIIHYQASDGRMIFAYLTLPRVANQKSLPLIVMPHGGPAARDGYGFDWWAQALASRGYAVLQPQYRGSDGFGNGLLEAGFGEFGRKMQTDLSDGVKALTDQGVIDPKRVCIVGASYGGYAAMAGITLQTGIYRCAIADAGLSDLHAMMNWIENHQYRQDNVETRYWGRYMGVKDAGSPALDPISPIEHIDNVNVPILLTHGTDDTVVQLGQSEKMAEALQKAGKTVEFVKMQDEDHWLSRSRTRLQMLQADIDFLMKYNPPD